MSEAQSNHSRKWPILGGESGGIPPAIGLPSGVIGVVAGVGGTGVGSSNYAGLAADSGDGSSARTMSGVERGAPVVGWETVDSGRRGGVGDDNRGGLEDGEKLVAVATSTTGTTQAPALPVEAAAAVGVARLIKVVMGVT